ncbi:unnamed protein product [Merluccius merluccius]
MILTWGLMGLWLIAVLTLNRMTFGGAVYSLNKPYVEFPPARPTAELLHSICEYSSHRLRYPPGYFPRSGVSHFRRCGRAIDRLESWYTACCTGQITQDYTQTLCCAEQAWKQALTTFCEEEQATMTAAHFCCAEVGDAMWMCFNNEELPNPQYRPRPGYTAPVQPPEQGFTFSPTDC